MTQLSLERRRLLWRTRGRDWDYLFVLRPEQPALPGWLQVFERVFPDDHAPRTGVYYARGALVAPRSQRPEYFVAAALTDPVRTDFAGRPLQHFFVYMLRTAAEVSAFEQGWAGPLLERLAASLDAVFTAQREEDDPVAFSQRLLRGVQQQLPETLALATTAEEVSPVEIPVFAVVEPSRGDEKKSLGPPLPAAGPSRWWLVLLALLLLWGLRTGCPVSPRAPAAGRSAR